MATEIRVPAIATAGARLSVGRWFKRAGDAVSSDEPIVEIEADNVTVEIRSPISGILTSVYVKDGALLRSGRFSELSADFEPARPDSGRTRMAGGSDKSNSARPISHG